MLFVLGVAARGDNDDRSERERDRGVSANQGGLYHVRIIAAHRARFNCHDCRWRARASEWFPREGVAASE